MHALCLSLSSLFCPRGERVVPGNIIIRQRGTRIHPGTNVRRAKDDTLFSVIDGIVTFERLGKRKKKVSVYTESE